MKACLTCIELYGQHIRMGEAEALQHVDRFKRHQVVDEKDIDEETEEINVWRS